MAPKSRTVRLNWAYFGSDLNSWPDGDSRVIIVIALAVRREDHRYSLVGEAPARLVQEYMWLNGAGRRDMDAESLSGLPGKGLRHLEALVIAWMMRSRAAADRFPLRRVGVPTTVCASHPNRWNHPRRQNLRRLGRFHTHRPGVSAGYVPNVGIARTIRNSPAT